MPSEILARLRASIDTGKNDQIQEGRRVQFFPGKRKGKDGITRKTGRTYWEWSFKDPDTGARRRTYGGSIETVPADYQYRVAQFYERQAALARRSLESYADALFRPAIHRAESGDTG